MAILPDAVVAAPARPGRQRDRVEVRAQSRTPAARLPPLRRRARSASRLPQSAPAIGPASSSSTSGPARAARATRSAQARSRPDGLSIAHSSANSSPSRARSTASAAPHVAPAPRETATSPSSAAQRLALRARARARRATKSRNSGAGRSGRDLNSGWYCEATKNGCVSRGSSIASTSRSSGEVPEHDQPGGLEPLAQVVVDLVAVAVALVDDRLAVELARARAVVQLHRVGAEAHRAAEVGDLLLLGQQVDHRERRLGVELGRVGARPCRRRGARTRRRRPACRGRCPGTGSPARARPGRRRSCPPCRARRSRRGSGCRRRRASRSRGARSASSCSESTQSTSTRAPWCDAGVAQRLGDRQVGVLELDVLADQRDPHGARRLARRAAIELLPARSGRAPAPRCRSGRGRSRRRPASRKTSGTL